MLSISVSPTTRILGRQYFDLPGIIALMERLAGESVVDGFEVQNLAEWDEREPPRDEREKRLTAWQESSKYSIDGIAAALQKTTSPILSVHANRDVGICLCSDQEQDIARGKQLIHEALALAEKVGAPVCVFHLWDTWKEMFDPTFLQNTLEGIAVDYPQVQASVENVPTHLRGTTPFTLVRRFPWITLDLRWAALYNELDEFRAVRDRIVNVHLRGRLTGGAWVLEGAPFGFYEALRTIRERWAYRGLWTLEPENLRGASWQDLVQTMSSLRG